MLNLKLLNDWNGEYFMKKIIALFVLSFIPAVTFAQNFDIEKNKMMIERKAYTAAQDNTRVVTNVKAALGTDTGFAKMLEAAGTNLKSPKDAANHAYLHIGILTGKYFGETKKDAIVSLSLLGSGDSPLVGNAKVIGSILTTLNNFYTKNKGNTEENCEIMLAIGLIANANYSLQVTEGTVGSLALKSLYQAVVNEKEEASVRRSAIVSLASMETPEAVTKISSCITAINKEIGTLSKMWNNADDGFVFDSKSGELSDNGDDSDNSIVTTLMLALDTQLDGKAKSKALSYLNWYAGLSYRDKYYHRIRNDYEAKGGSETTYLAALYILAHRSNFKHSYLTSDVKYSRIGNRGVYIETGTSQKLVPIIEKQDGPGSYECYTRRAFNEAYHQVAFQFFRQGQMWSGNEQPPIQPCSFDNCLKQKTNKVMFEVTAMLLSGGVDGLIAKVVIKSAAKRLAAQALSRAAFSAATTAIKGEGAGASAKSAGQTAIATYASHILGGVFHIKAGILYNIYDHGNSAMNIGSAASM